MALVVVVPEYSSNNSSVRCFSETRKLRKDNFIFDRRCYKIINLNMQCSPCWRFISRG